MYVLTVLLWQVCVQAHANIVEAQAAIEAELSDSFYCGMQTMSKGYTQVFSLWAGPYPPPPPSLA